jgi:hypothetical protein
MANKFDKVRIDYMNKIEGFLESEMSADVLRTGSQEYCVPIVNEEGDEGYLVITFKIPKGSRDGEEYDGYAMAQDYKMKVEAKRAKAEESARKKAEKIERDRKAREEKARLKAEREKEKEE